MIPLEYGPMGSVTGKRYDAIKDFLRWEGYPLKRWVPVFVQMGIAWAEGLQRRDK